MYILFLSFNFNGTFNETGVCINLCNSLKLYIHPGAKLGLSTTNDNFDKSQHSDNLYGSEATQSSIEAFEHRANIQCSTLDHEQINSGFMLPIELSIIFSETFD